ncbi:MAG: HipA domain-containing protein [Flavobacteriales bacterium]|nr:HipA domain-containing protein [Flavobacteriales bacterium]
MAVSKLNISIQFSEKEQRVGQLIQDGREVLFKYDEDYLAKGFNLSPKKLPFGNEVQTGPIRPFEGMFGVFADSLPDAWGQLLLKAQLTKKKVAIESLTMIDRLAFVGNNGPGALIYKPSLYEQNEGLKAIELDALANVASETLKGQSSDVLDELFGQGGSPGGARPKLYVSYNQLDDSLLSSGVSLPENHEHWILKFAATDDALDIASIELAYYYMALEAGIKMNNCKLFTGASGKKYFGTKRFDREGNQRVHMLSVAGLIHDD